MTHNRITGSIAIELTVQEIAKINSLLARDEPMLAKKLDGGGYKCPMCGAYVHTTDNFCDTCGQRIDTEDCTL